MRWTGLMKGTLVVFFQRARRWARPKVKVAVWKQGRGGQGRDGTVQMSHVMSSESQAGKDATPVAPGCGVD